MNNQQLRMVCLQCGTGGRCARTIDEAWESVRHDGHGHSAEQMAAEEALALGAALVVSASSEADTKE